MIVFQQLLKQRKLTLEKIIRDTRRLLAQAPEGILRIIPHKKGVQYYRRKDTKDYNGSYIRKEDMQLARNLGQKKYNQMLLKSAEKEQALIDNLLDYYESGNVNDLYDELNPSLQAVVSPLIINKNEQITRWYNTPYERMAISFNSPTYQSARKEDMRSKSEVFIAQILDKHNIPYLYEKPLTLKGYGTIYPDFTILDPYTLEEIYIEHLGLIMNLDYLEKNLGKISAYNKNGIYLGDRLLITYETNKNPLDLKLIENIILTRLHRAIIELN
ncbi:MAG: hypothetical protein Q4E53_09560 [Eubacteriales bacterium]|nr:hypothetical protein [Eubacteriales bacterium]